MSRLRVHAASSLFAERRTSLESHAGERVEWTIGPGETPDPRTSVLVAGRPSAELLESLPALTTLVIPYVGVPRRTMELVLERPQLQLLHVHHNAEAVTEGALALLFAAARRIIPMHNSLRRLDWTPRYAPDPAMRLSGRRALVLGYGAIGTRIARVLNTLGLAVDVVRRTPEVDGAHREHGLSALDPLLPEADIVVITLPSTAATRGVLDARRLALLPSHAVLVNVGRADIVDEGALYAALNEGRLGAAGLDVWYAYPTSEDERRYKEPSAFPFHELDNVVLSPHRSAHDDKVEHDRVEHVGALMRNIAEGRDISAWAVDTEEGY